MSLKYKVIKNVMRILNLQKMMSQPYVKLQKTFKTEKAVPNIPKLSNKNFNFEVFTVSGQPVLHVKHKKYTDKVCIYVVGGGMLKYPKASQAKQMITLADELQSNIILPYYPLVPKHNIYDVYDMLYQTYKIILKDYNAENVSFLGGSSGGNHTLGLISYINAKNEGIAMPGKIYISSPGTMLMSDEEKMMGEKLDKTDLIMSRQALETIFSGMVGDKDVPDYMKYLQLGNYTGLKSAYLCFGGDELFSGAAESIKSRLIECGVDVTLEIGEGLYHCYSAMPLVKEAQQGYNNMIAYLKG